MCATMSSESVVNDIHIQATDFSRNRLLRCWQLCGEIYQVLKRLPNLKKIDGVPVDVEEKDMAADA